MTNPHSLLPDRCPRSGVRYWLRLASLLGLVALLLEPSALAARALEDLPWRSVGPEGGCVAQMVELADGRLLAATCGGVLFVAPADGGAWLRVGSTPSPAIGMRIAADPRDPDVLFATPFAPGRSIGSPRLLRSGDLGASWRELLVNDGRSRIGDLLALPASGGATTLLWMLTERADFGGPRAILWRSSDGGDTWEAVGEGLPESARVDLAALPAAPDVVYAFGGETEAVYRSDDGGRTFVPAGNGLPEGRGRVLAPAPGRPARVYALVEDGTIHRSDDGGGSWRATGPRFRFSERRPDLRVDPADPDTIFLLVASRLWMSRDGGTSFRRLQPSFSAGEAGVGDAVTAVLPRAGGLLVATASAIGTAPGGIALTRDGGDSWSLRNRGLNAVDLEGVAAVPDGSGDLLAFTTAAVLRGSGVDRIWRSLPPVVEGGALPVRLRSLFVDPFDGSHLVVGGEGRRFESRDGGWRWVSREILCAALTTVAFLPATDGGVLTGGIWNGTGCILADACAFHRRGSYRTEPVCARDGRREPNQLRQLRIAPSDPQRVYGHFGELYASRDGGGTWSTPGHPQRAEGGSSFGASALAVDPFVAEVVWLGLADGTVWRSGNGGRSWALRSPPEGWPAAPLDTKGEPAEVGPPVASIQVDPVDPERLYVLSGGRIWGSGDGGASWRLLSAGLPPRPVLDLDLDPAEPTVVYAVVQDLGVWRLEGRATPGVCVPTDTSLCLGPEDRFRVRVTWRDFLDRSGAGRGTERTEQTGTFRFFDGDNTELVVKILDGRPVNGRWWVFYAALSNVPYTLVVSDRRTGEVAGYLNPERRFASVGDTAAFPDGAPRVPAGEPPPVDTSRSFVTPAPCQPGLETLCLADGRFRVEARWRDFLGGTGAGRVIPDEAAGGDFRDGADTGYLWFFAPGNYELAVKVIDGRSLNGHWWLFYGSLSNVAYRLTVTDTLTGEVVEYRNPEGVFASHGDVRAFRQIP